jgi:hypothetical protein
VGGSTTRIYTVLYLLCFPLSGPVSRVHLPLVLPVTPPPDPLVVQSLVYFISPRFRAFVPLAVFVLVNHHVPVVLGESTCRKWSESTKGKAWSGSKLGRAGDGARELLPWTACPGTQKNLDPEHPLARDSGGCLALRSFYILV